MLSLYMLHFLQMHSPYTREKHFFQLQITAKDVLGMVMPVSQVGWVWKGFLPPLWELSNISCQLAQKHVTKKIMLQLLRVILHVCENLMFYLKFFYHI